MQRHSLLWRQVVLTRRQAVSIRVSVLSVPIKSRMMAAVWLGLCYQTAAVSPVAAENAKSTGERSLLERRASQRIGVSVTVLPSCAIRINGASGSVSGQPVDIRCTKNTQYDVGLDGGAGQLVSIGPESTFKQSAGSYAKQSNGQSDLFLLEQAQTSEKKRLIAGRAATILAIDF